MATLKKVFLLIFLSCISFFGNAQNKGDIGILFTSYDQFRTGFEYRKPIGEAEKYRLKMGATFGGTGNFLYPNYEIFEVTDTTFSSRHFAEQSNWIGMRFGFERILGNSFFSVGADLNLGYQNHQQSYSNQNWTLNENGDWVSEGFAPFFALNENGQNATITRHFLDPTVRFGFNMDAPLGKAFLLNFTISTSVGMPVYMGATDVIDPLNEFLGSPPTLINWSTNVGAGIRYRLGVKEI